MDGCYAECAVQRKMTPKAVLLLAGMAAALTGATALTLMTPWGILVLAAVIIGVLLLYRFLRVEYEYIFVTGEIQIDKIYSKSTRKKGPRVDMDTVEVIEPMDPGRLENVKSSGNVRILDYSSHQPGAVVYAAVFHGAEGTGYLLFEPDEKMLKTLRRYAPGKVKQIQNPS